jgi:hypothetical protein
MKFKATAEDLAKGQIVNVGWQVVEMYKLEEATDNDGAGLLKVFAKVIGGKEEDKGAVLRAQFSEKAQGMIKNFYEALTGQPFVADKEVDVRESHVRGKKMEWYIERGKYRGRDTNEVVDYRPVQS